MSQSCFFSGLQFLLLLRVGKVPSHHAIHLRGSWGSSWWLSSLPIFSLSCLLPPAIPLRSQRHREGTCCPCSVQGRAQPADYRCGGLQVGSEVLLASPGDTAHHLLGLPFFPQIAKQSLRPFCTVCNRYFKTPRKFVEHVKSQGHKDKAKEVTPAPSKDMGPEMYRALAKATQQVEIYPRLSSQQVWRHWNSQGYEVHGVWDLGCPELT